MRLCNIKANIFKLDGGAMFSVVPKSLWTRYIDADKKNLCAWAANCLLVEDNNQLIIIDTGLGNKQSEDFFKHYDLHPDYTLIGELAKAGYEPEQITDVIMTHLHFDHCGGAVSSHNERYVPTFPNAKYWTHESQWRWATESPNPREKASFFLENILPIKEREQLFFINENTEIHPDLSFEFYYGHTEGLTGVLLNYKGRRVWAPNDLVPSYAHVPTPYIMSYDIRPLVTMKEKQTTLKRALETDTILFFAHDNEFECCDLKMTEKGIRVKNRFNISDL